MFASPLNTATIKTTSYKVVLPFYVYAAISFLVATILLFTSTHAFTAHYFSPHLLAITHAMALGWGTMIILGASHQLVPVLAEGKLYSNKLAYTSFIFAAIGIPMLVYAFYIFDMGPLAKWGGRCIIIAVVAYLINISMSIKQSKNENIHAIYAFTATWWLLVTVTFGLALVYNNTYPLLPHDSFHYLPLHAHAGMVGWFFLLVIGVASRLIPMFLISKYTNNKLLWVIYFLLNGALLFYFIFFYFISETAVTFISVGSVFIAIILFIYFCIQAYKKRLRKQVDEQTKISILSIFILLIPIILLTMVIFTLITTSGEKVNFILAYGFLIFFGWLTSIILGMTFKTMPFIVWNKVYHHRSSLGKTPNPKDLFNHIVFKMMSIFYLSGLVVFVVGILFSLILIMKIGAALLIIAAALYNWNVIKLMIHKPHML